MSAVKAVVQDRISKTEEELGHLCSWQEQLVGKQGEFQVGIQEFARLKLTMEGMITKSVGEPESIGSKSSLSITAPVFVPTAGTSLATPEGESDRGGSKAMQRPAPYDGSSVWEAYRTQFGLLAGWTDQEKAAYLAISLRGTALMVLTLTNLP